MSNVSIIMHENRVLGIYPQGQNNGDDARNRPLLHTGLGYIFIRTWKQAGK